ncbi:hypothetical protein DID77_00470 [Candidatus Marinamargulisbacteria bacterium SCGC AG-439-L15]|nr:hypothetical protein DID77_00470 [Candidatus Marinamargulisbacteria bacterium SCGC AG-439-L15]
MHGKSRTTHTLSSVKIHRHPGSTANSGKKPNRKKPQSSQVKKLPSVTHKSRVKRLPSEVKKLIDGLPRPIQKYVLSELSQTVSTRSTIRRHRGTITAAKDKHEATKKLKAKKRNKQKERQQNHSKSTPISIEVSNAVRNFIQTRHSGAFNGPPMMPPNDDQLGPPIFAHISNNKKEEVEVSVFNVKTTHEVLAHFDNRNTFVNGTIFLTHLKDRPRGYDKFPNPPFPSLRIDREASRETVPEIHFELQKGKGIHTANGGGAIAGILVQTETVFTTDEWVTAWLTSLKTGYFCVLTKESANQQASYSLRGGRPCR